MGPVRCWAGSSEKGRAANPGYRQIRASGNLVFTEVCFWERAQPSTAVSPQVCCEPKANGFTLALLPLSYPTRLEVGLGLARCSCPDFRTVFQLLSGMRLCIQAQASKKHQSVQSSHLSVSVICPLAGS